MDYWNLLVVLCFAVLYLGLSVLFVRLRRMQHDMKDYHAQLHEQLRGQQPDASVVAQACADLVGRQLALVEQRIELQIRVAGSASLGQQLSAMEERMGHQIQVMGDRLLGDLHMIQGDMRLFSRQDDAYREARLLLSHGIDEERVAAETGRTMEEIRLLKRVSGLGHRFGHTAPRVHAEPVETRWGYPPVDRFEAGGRIKKGGQETGLVRLVVPEASGEVLPSDQGREDHAGFAAQVQEGSALRSRQVLEDPVRLAEPAQEGSTTRVATRSQQKRQRHHGRGRARHKNRKSVQDPGNFKTPVIPLIRTPAK